MKTVLTRKIRLRKKPYSIYKSEKEYELSSSRSFPIVIDSSGELTAQVTDGIIIKRDSQFQFNSHPQFAIAQIPDAFTQNGVHHRSDFILSAPNGIVVSHSIRYSVLR